MKLLALESSAVAASVALLEGQRVVGEFFLSTAQTHSQTLLPMTQQLLADTGLSLPQLDLLAVSNGPGSFTGLRIGLAAVKGMAFGADKPCVGVSTLEALAYNLRGFEGIAVAVMDARCRQVYTARFSLSEGRVERLSPDEAISLEELGKVLEKEEKPLFLVGDGAEMCYNQLLDKLPQLRLAPPHLRLQRASSVGACALEHYAAGEGVSCGELTPTYLRLPQAERELLKRTSQGSEGTPSLAQAGKE